MLIVIGVLLLLLSSVSFLTFVILLIIRAATNKGLSFKINLIFVAGSVVVGLISIFMLFTSFPNEADKAFSDTAENSNEIAQKQKDEEKKKAKAEEEKEAKKKEEEEKKKIEEEKAAKKKKAEAKKKAEKEAEEKKAAEKKEKEKEQKEKEQKEKEQKEKEKEKKKEKKKKAKKESKKKKTIEEKIVEENNSIKKATFKDGFISLKLDGDGSFTVNTMFTNQSLDAFKAMEQAFKDKKVTTASAVVNVTMTDNKGNEEKKEVLNFMYDRDTFEELNFENFRNMALGEPWRIYNESDSYYIHPGIFNDLKEDISSNLSHGAIKAKQ